MPLIQPLLHEERIASKRTEVRRKISSFFFSIFSSFVPAAQELIHPAVHVYHVPLASPLLSSLAACWSHLRKILLWFFFLFWFFDSCIWARLASPCYCFFFILRMIQKMKYKTLIHLHQLTYCIWLYNRVPNRERGRNPWRVKHAEECTACLEGVRKHNAVPWEE